VNICSVVVLIKLNNTALCPRNGTAEQMGTFSKLVVLL